MSSQPSIGVAKMVIYEKSWKSSDYDWGHGELWYDVELLATCQVMSPSTKRASDRWLVRMRNDRINEKNMFHRASICCLHTQKNTVT